jgi:acetoin utilization deacetylase AcuC-like enzyme
MFASDDRVTTFDCFCDSNYPWRSRRKSTYDVPLPDDISDEDYLSLIQSWLLRLVDLSPELVIYQAGVDVLAQDALGNLQLSRSCLNARNNAVYSFALQNKFPLVICMGGGYARPDIAPSVAAHADVFRTAAMRLSAATSAG